MKNSLIMLFSYVRFSRGSNTMTNEIFQIKRDEKNFRKIQLCRNTAQWNAIRLLSSWYQMREIYTL